MAEEEKEQTAEASLPERPQVKRGRARRPPVEGVGFYPYRPPRVDEELYQADLPDLVYCNDIVTAGPHATPDQGAGEAKTRARGKARDKGRSAGASSRPAPELRPGQLSISDNLVWSPSLAEDDDLSRFLLFQRNLVEQSSVEVGASGRQAHAQGQPFQWPSDSHGFPVPLEADERALQYLARRAGNLEQAQLLATCQATKGTSEKSLQIAKYRQRNRQATPAWQGRAPPPAPPLGVFTSSSSADPATPYLYPELPIPEGVPEPEAEAVPQPDGGNGGASEAPAALVPAAATGAELGAIAAASSDAAAAAAPSPLVAIAEDNSGGAGNGSSPVDTDSGAGAGAEQPEASSADASSPLQAAQQSAEASSPEEVVVSASGDSVLPVEEPGDVEPAVAATPEKALLSAEAGMEEDKNGKPGAESKPGAEKPAATEKPPKPEKRERRRREADTFDRRRGMDRAEIRNRWQSLLDRMQRAASGRGSSKPALDECVALLAEPASLPPPDHGDEVIEALQKAASSITNLVMSGRQWVAKVTDVIGGRHAGAPLPTAGEIQRLITETNTLPVKVREVSALRELLTQASAWQDRAVNLLLRVYNIGLPYHDAVAEAAAAEGGACAVVAYYIIEVSLAVPGNSSAHHGADSPDGGRRRVRGSTSEFVPLEEIKQLLEDAKDVAVRMPQVKILKAALTCVDAVVTRANELFPPPRKPGMPAERGAAAASRRIKPDYPSVPRLMDTVHALGIAFPAGEALQKNADVVERWVEAAEKAVSGVVSMKELSTLLQEASALPVDVGDKVVAVQAKLDAAVAWLDRVRRAIPKSSKTGANTRRGGGGGSARTGSTAGDGGKTNLEDVRDLLSEREQTGVLVDAKEVDAVSSLIDTADEWLSRVRTALEEGEEATLQSLADLLSEADGLPVSMEEHRTLTVAIKARQWRLRVEAKLATRKARLDELRKLAAEGANLRSDFPDSAKTNKLYSVLKDKKLRRLLVAAESWNGRARRCASDLKSGKPLTRHKVCALVAEAQAMPLDLSPELDTLTRAMDDVNEWLRDTRTLLAVCGITTSRMEAARAAEVAAEARAVALAAEIAAKEEAERIAAAEAIAAAERAEKAAVEAAAAAAAVADTAQQLALSFGASDMDVVSADGAVSEVAAPEAAAAAVAEPRGEQSLGTGGSGAAAPQANGVKSETATPASAARSVTVGKLAARPEDTSAASVAASAAFSAANGVNSAASKPLGDKKLGPKKPFEKPAIRTMLPPRPLELASPPVTPAASVAASAVSDMTADDEDKEDETLASIKREGTTSYYPDDENDDEYLDDADDAKQQDSRPTLRRTRSKRTRSAAALEADEDAEYIAKLDPDDEEYEEESEAGAKASGGFDRTRSNRSSSKRSRTRSSSNRSKKKARRSGSDRRSTGASGGGGGEREVSDDEFEPEEVIGDGSEYYAAILARHEDALASVLEHDVEDDVKEVAQAVSESVQAMRDFEAEEAALDFAAFALAEGGQRKVPLDDVANAVSMGERVALAKNLREIKELKELQAKVSEWSVRAQAACPRKQGGRRVQPKSKPPFKDIQEILDQANSFPIELTEEGRRVRGYVAAAKDWQARSRTFLVAATVALAEETDKRIEIWKKYASTGTRRRNSSSLGAMNDADYLNSGDNDDWDDLDDDNVSEFGDGGSRSDGRLTPRSGRSTPISRPRPPRRQKAKAAAAAAAALALANSDEEEDSGLYAQLDAAGAEELALADAKAAVRKAKASTKGKKGAAALVAGGDGSDVLLAAGVGGGELDAWKPESSKGDAMAHASSDVAEPKETLPAMADSMATDVALLDGNIGVELPAAAADAAEEPASIAEGGMQVDDAALAAGAPMQDGIQLESASDQAMGIDAAQVGSSESAFAPPTSSAFAAIGGDAASVEALDAAPASQAATGEAAGASALAAAFPAPAESEQAGELSESAAAVADAFASEPIAAAGSLAASGLAIGDCTGSAAAILADVTETNLSIGGDGPPEMVEADEPDPEDPLDAAELARTQQLEALFEEGRRINVYMPEEVLAERILALHEWTREVRETLDGGYGKLSTADARELLESGEETCDFQAMAQGDDSIVLAPEVVEAVNRVAAGYHGRLDELRKRLERAEEWNERAANALGRGTPNLAATNIKALEDLLQEAVDLGLEHDDYRRKLRNEVNKTRNWLSRVELALRGRARPSLAVARKLVAEGEKLRLAGEDLSKVRGHVKAANKWVQGYRRVVSQHERAAGGHNSALPLLREALNIKVDLSEESTALRASVGMTCMCGLPDDGVMLHCKACFYAFHPSCMGLTEADALADTAGEEPPYVCTKCCTRALSVMGERFMLQAIQWWGPLTHMKLPPVPDRLLRNLDLEASGHDGGVGISNPFVGEMDALGRETATGNFREVMKVVRDALSMSFMQVSRMALLQEVHTNITAFEDFTWNCSPMMAQQQFHQGRLILECLQTLLWCSVMQWALAVRGKPRLSLLMALLTYVRILKVRDPAIMAFLESVVKRAQDWQEDARAALAPKPDYLPGETVDAEEIKKLHKRLQIIPVSMPEEKAVLAITAEGLERYCLCGAPNNGATMVACDVCEMWFHGRCVNVTEAVLREMEVANAARAAAAAHDGDLTAAEPPAIDAPRPEQEYMCPKCCLKTGTPYRYGLIDLSNPLENAKLLWAEDPVPAPDPSVALAEGYWPPRICEYINMLDLSEPNHSAAAVAAAAAAATVNAPAGSRVTTYAAPAYPHSYGIPAAYSAAQHNHYQTMAPPAGASQPVPSHSDGGSGGSGGGGGGGGSSKATGKRARSVPDAGGFPAGELLSGPLAASPAAAAFSTSFDSGNGLGGSSSGSARSVLGGGGSSGSARSLALAASPPKKRGRPPNASNGGGRAGSSHSRPPV